LAGSVVVAETYFDEWIARRYARLWPELFDPTVLDPTVDFLARLAGAGPALEFGIGTGRVALPLARRGVRIHGHVSVWQKRRVRNARLSSGRSHRFDVKM
jgi:hypothetical protein